MRRRDLLELRRKWIKETECKKTGCSRLRIKMGGASRNGGGIEVDVGIPQALDKGRCWRV